MYLKENREREKKRGDETLFMRSPEDVTLPHSSDSGGGEISTAAAQNWSHSPPPPSSSNLLVLPQPLLRAHHICACGELYRAGTQGFKLFFSSNFIYTYLFIPVCIHNAFQKRPNMLMYVRMLQTF